jgi:lysophospholipase
MNNVSAQHSAEIRGADPINRRAIPDFASVSQITATDGWPLRRIIYDAPDGGIATRGSLLFLGGRGDYFEKYLESMAEWRNAGWGVESIDWRGQGGSGQFVADSNVGHVPDFALWISDLAANFAEWRARTPAPHVVVAHSMGGHLVMRALAEQAIAPDAAVLVAPMCGFTAPYPDSLGHRIARIMCAIGKPERAAWKVSEKPGVSVRLRQLLLTHDDERYADEMWWRVADASLERGPASWRWVERGYASFIGLAQPGVLERITTPLLILGAANDKLVSSKAIRRDAARISSATLHIYGAEASHELLRETDAVRDDAMGRIDIFLKQVLSQ